MAGVGRGWTKALAVAVLLMGAGMVGLAQSAPSRSIEDGSYGSLSGQLTDLHSKPLAGVALVLRNQSTGAEARAITATNGAYRFTGLKPGEYTLEAESPQLGHGQVGEIVVVAGQEARVRAAMEFAPLSPSPLLASSQGVNRIDLSRPAVTWPDLEPAASPVSGAALAAEPLRTLALAGRSRENPAPPALAASAPATAVSAPVAATSAPVTATSVPAAAAFTPSTATSAPATVASVSARAGANGAGQTSGTVQTPPHPAGPATAAAQTAQPPRSPVQAASQASSATAPAVTSTTSAAELQALPISGRHWQDFVLNNTPTSVTPARGQGQIALRGAGESAEVAVDGFDKRLAFGPTGGTSGSGQGSSGQGPLGQGGPGSAGIAQVGAGGHGFAVSETAIREVRTATGNAEAAAARAAGGRMNVETRSGANELHGQGFLFDRQNNWGAQNPFTQWARETAPATEIAIPAFTPEPYTPPDRETVWGIGVGSRIRRDKLFWFAALDNNQRNDPGLSMVKHPYLCKNVQCTEQTGFFAQPSNDEMEVLASRLGLSNANPLVEGLTAYSCMLETLVGTLGGSSSDCPSGWPLGGLLGPAPRTSSQWTGFGRLDWQATERQHLTLEGVGGRWNSPGGGVTRLSETYGNHSFGSTKASEEWLQGRWEAFLTPNLMAVTQASVGDAIQEARPSTPSAFEKTFLAGNVWGQLPQIVVDDRYGFTIGNPSRFGKGSYPDEHIYFGGEQVDWVHSKLLVKAGFDVSRNADAISLLRNQTGTYTYENTVNFASDALAFGKYGLTDALDPYNQHNCDETGRASWRDSGGGLRGVGNLPCYSYYSQTIGPAGWSLSTNDWADYVTAQWQQGRQLVLSAGLRWEREQLPPPLAALSNPGPLLTQKLPDLGNNWGPRVSLALGSGEGRWPVLQLAYGMYFGRTPNLTVETALTQTGSPKGDLSFFMRPTDDLPNYGGGAPPFPYVPRPPGPGSVIMPGAVEFAPSFHNPEVHQAVAAVEESLPGGIELTASAMASLGRRLPISIDTNLDLPTPLQTIKYNVVDSTGKGPIDTTKTPQITVPFYASWPTETPGQTCPNYPPPSTGVAGRPNPCYQQITQITSKANSTYEAAMLRVVRYGRRGLSLHAHYIYSHAMDWNPNEGAQAAGNDVLNPAAFTDPAAFRLEYGTSNLDVRHSAVAMVIYETPWKLRGAAGKLANHWMVSGIGEFRSGLPYTMRTSGSLAKLFDSAGNAIVGMGPGMNGSGGDNRVYGVGNDNVTYNIGRNTFRYPATWKADLRLGKGFDLGHMRQLELLAESFNLFNHQNVTELETTGYYIESGSPPSTLGTPGTPPTLNFLTGPVVKASGAILHPNATAFGQPLNINATNFYRERQIQFGLRFRF